MKSSPLEPDVIGALLHRGAVSPRVFRAALDGVPPADRDVWADRVLGLEDLPADGPDLPRGCVPYVPCPIEKLLDVLETAEVGATDLFVDIGAGAGRTAALTHLLTGAGVVGIEVQSALVRAYRALTEALHASRVTVLTGDAARWTPRMTSGTAFFLYCPFSGARLERVLDDLEGLARARRIRVGCVDLPPLQRPGFVPMGPSRDGVAVYESVLHLSCADR